MKKVLIAITVCGFLFGTALTYSSIAAHYGDAQKYIASLTHGESYHNIHYKTPKWLILEDLHEFKDTTWSMPSHEEPLETYPTHIMILVSRGFPINMPYVYALLFDEHKRLLGCVCIGI